MRAAASFLVCGHLCLLGNISEHGLGQEVGVFLKRRLGEPGFSPKLGRQEGVCVRKGVEGCLHTEQKHLTHVGQMIDSPT